MCWQSFFDLSTSCEYQIVEYYAGIARIARLGSAYGYRAGAFDVVYDHPQVTESWPGSSSPKRKRRVRTAQTGKKVGMDLTTSSGFLLLGW